MYKQTENTSMLRCALDASRQEAFTERTFSDLITESYSRGCDYYVARVHCLDQKKKGTTSIPSSVYYCYDAKQLCRHLFEMVISSEGRKIRIKQFTDPLTGKEINEINFFRLRCDSETPLRAEFVGTHETFLESALFRSKIFSMEDALEALSVNFEFKAGPKITHIQKKKIVDIFLIIIILFLIGIGGFFGGKLLKDIVSYNSSGAIKKNSSSARSARFKNVISKLESVTHNLINKL